MEKYRKTEILQIVEEEGVEFIRLQFTDMFGTLKNVAVPVSCLEKAMDDRCTIDVLRMEKLPVFCVMYAQRMAANTN